ncbi:MAG: hypothetical protein ACYDH9_07640 [Limisphaerales bacterium]
MPLVADRSRTKGRKMEHYGVALGLGLLVLVTACAVLLARKAARGVEEFREEHHEDFVTRKKR